MSKRGIAGPGAEHSAQSADYNQEWHELLESVGPWPFVTRRVFRRADGSSHTWLSRAHRKQLITGIEQAELRRRDWLWAPGQLNWWIGTIFAFGALLFAVGCVLSLVPTLAVKLNFSPTEVNAVFFAGSIPFTVAAYLQLFQAANAPPPGFQSTLVPQQRRLFGWRPKDIGWLSCALQFPGTVLFNVNTFDALLPGLDWFQQELEIWLPNILGSILFLASGYLAFVETCHRHVAWRPAELSWWVTLVNLLGCIGFMLAAVFAIVLPGGVNETWLTISLAFTLQGAACFFIGSLLLLPETSGAQPASS